VAYRVLVGKPVEKRALGNPRRRCEDNIKMEVQEMELEGMDCIDFAHSGKLALKEAVDLW
jgi:hypothetical protein